MAPTSRKKSASSSRGLSSGRGSARKVARPPREITRTERIARSFAAWSLRALGTIGLGVLLGGSIVVFALMREARDTVERRLDGSQPWSVPGRVLSGPIELRAGMTLTPGELAGFLRSAGYAQVGAIAAPRDFRVSENAVEVRAAPASGPGWEVRGGDVRVAFAEGRVKRVTPRGAVLEATQLSTLADEKAERRQNIRLSAIPMDLRKAVLLMEDESFYEHPGLSLSGVLRALFMDLTRRGVVQGGSTLTQQLAKNLFLTPERTVARKAREAFLALALEKRLGKDEILELYLNGIYLGQAGGQAIHGVGEASRVYFGKSVGRLSLGESATLAGIISGPNAYSPLKHPERAIERRDVVLGKMAAVGYVSEQVARKEMSAPLQILPTAITREAPWGVDLATEEVESRSGQGSAVARGMIVHTTLSPVVQRLAEFAVRTGLAQVEARHERARGVEVAMVVLRARDGAVLALVGGRDYGRSNFDRAAFAKRPIGSVVKALTLVEAFDRDLELSSATRFPDEPIEREVNGTVWRPTNYDGQFRGDTSLREAVIQSRNVPLVLLAERTGLKTLRDFWRKAGLAGATSFPSAALGAFDATPLQVAEAFTLFPNRGEVARPHLVRAAFDAAGAAVLVNRTRTERLVSSRAAAMATRVLEGVMSEGTATSASKYGARAPMAGKTGTTDEGRDAWFVGFTPELVAVVWVGFDRDKAHGLTGAQAALPIWAGFIAAMGPAEGAFAEDPEVETVTLCAQSRQIAGETCRRKEPAWFTRGHAPTEPCTSSHDGDAAPAPGETSAASEQGEGLTGKLLRRFKKDEISKRGEEGAKATPSPPDAKKTRKKSTKKPKKGGKI